MDIRWTPQAINCLNKINSIHFTKYETKVYKKKLVNEIESKVKLLKTSIHSKEPGWHGTYKDILFTLLR